jgi:hypothetical protein
MIVKRVKRKDIALHIDMLAILRECRVYYIKGNRY